MLEFGNNLLDGVFAVAALDDFEAGAVEAQSAFRHEQRAGLLALFIHAAAGSEARTATRFDTHREPASVFGQKAPGGGQPG